MLLPLFIIAPAILAAAVMAYGTHPSLAYLAHGIDLIALGRRLQWLLAFVSLALCISLLGLVISGRRRAWWLIGLAPVLALFAARFSTRFNPPKFIAESPVFSEAAYPGPLEDGDWVVGVEFNNQSYAFPYRVLGTAPVVQITDYDQRVLLMWSASANRAVAYTLMREMRPRDLEIVGSPANSLMIYDRRLGQFIIGVTGRKIDGSKPTGFVKEVETQRTTWGSWKTRHPETKVMRLNTASGVTEPILPRYPMPLVDDSLPRDATITLIATTQPAAIVSDAAPKEPMNTSAGATRILLLRDPKSGALHAFDRQLDQDLFLTFKPKPYRRTPEAVMIDNETESAWTPSGHAVEGPLKGQKLREIDTETLLYWGVMKFWYPNLQLIHAPAG